MTTFARQMDFDGPQPFNVDMTPERSLYPVVRFGKQIRATVPVVAQEITQDRNLYPPRGRGVRPQGSPRPAKR